MYPQAISHGNVLTFTPPGFNQELNVKFPDSRLAVCERCKKNYKTRDMCRVRNNHTAPPWTTAYICITLDDSCTDENGKYIDKPLTVRMVQWQPFCVKKPFDPQHPVCSSCKKTNRTRSFCRERHKHRQLPWCTVYVMLSALESTDPSTIVADPSKPLDGKEEGGSNGDAGKDDAEEEANGTLSEKPEAAKETAAASEKGQDDEAGMIDNDDFVETDDINEIPESRTFLARVSYKGTTIHWLRITDGDGSETNGFSLSQDALAQQNALLKGAPMDPAQAQYYAQAMGYGAPQHAGKPPPQQPYYYQGQQQQPYPGHQWPTQFPQRPDLPLGAVAVTAGEAAAQQQKQNQGAVDGDPNGQGQWQMVYQGQLYGYGQGEQSEQGQLSHEAVQENGHGGGMDPVGGEGEEPDAKRFRSV